MRTIGALATTAILSLLFLTTVPAYPQDREESGPEAKPSQQQEGREKEKDKAAKPGEGKPAQEPAGRPEVQNGTQDDRGGQPAASRPQEQRSGQQMERGGSQRVRAQRGKRIPDEKFRVSFGPRHTFRVQRAQIVNVSQPTIVYGGYSFVLVEPWPTLWGFDDVVFVDFVDDEYFLFDPLYPRLRVALVVVE